MPTHHRHRPVLSHLAHPLQLASRPSPFDHCPVEQFQLPLTLFFIILVEPFEYLTVWPLEYAQPVHHVVFPLTSV